MRAILSILIVAVVAGALAVPAMLPDEAAARAPGQITASEQIHAAQDGPDESQIEQATGLEYQNDADVHGDAPGTCATVDERRIVAVDANETLAMMVEGDDEADAFAVPIGTEYDGRRLTFKLLPSVIDAELYEFSFDIVDANCGFSVLDPDADIYHPERNAPAEPFESRVGYASYDLETEAPGSCNANEWKFNVKHDRGAAMGNLYVEWSNGDYTYVEHDDKDPSQVSKYLTSYNTKHTIARIVVEAPITWGGSMVVAHGPCNTTEYTVEAPTTDGYEASFTVVQPDAYVLLVTMERGVTDQVNDLVPTRCHDDYGCFMQRELSYRALLHTDDLS